MRCTHDISHTTPKPKLYLKTHKQIEAHNTREVPDFIYPKAYIVSRLLSSVTAPSTTGFSRTTGVVATTAVIIVAAGIHTRVTTLGRATTTLQ